jgi:hypothetical protein
MLCRRSSKDRGQEGMMGNIVKLAMLSAVLAAAVVTALQAARPRSVGEFLIERIEQQVPPTPLRLGDAGVGHAWPYREDCLAPMGRGATPRAVRIIDIDRIDSLPGTRTGLSRMAER